MMRSRVWVLAVLISLLALPVFSFDGVSPDHKNFRYQTMVFTTVQQSWAVNELYAQIAGSSIPSNDLLEKYNKACEMFTKASEELGKAVLSTLDSRDREVVELVSSIYKSFDPIGRQALYPALGVVKRSLMVELRSPITEAEFREYFPGYGYTEPGFKYRKGREISRENKGTSWQSEEHSITTTITVELTVTLDVLNILKGWLTGGIIKNLEVKESHETTMGGEPMIVFKVTFQIVKSIVTKTNRKFDVNKIWFELLRTKSGGWGGGAAAWEVCGKTYEILQEPTGEEIVTGITAN